MRFNGFLRLGKTALRRRSMFHFGNWHLNISFGHFLVTPKEKNP